MTKATISGARRFLDGMMRSTYALQTAQHGCVSLKTGAERGKSTGGTNQLLKEHFTPKGFSGYKAKVFFIAGSKRYNGSCVHMNVREPVLYSLVPFELKIESILKSHIISFVEF